MCIQSGLPIARAKAIRTSYAYMQSRDATKVTETDHNVPDRPFQTHQKWCINRHVSRANAEVMLGNKREKVQTCPPF